MAVQETAVQKTGVRWKKFFREVKAEFKKISWPNSRQLVAYTGVVFVAVIIVSLMIWIIDAGFASLLRIFLK
jgi:preprotein translocase subunit SecE